MTRNKVSRHISELKMAKWERNYVKGISMKGYRKSVARAERRATKVDLRNWEVNHG